MVLVEDRFGSKAERLAMSIFSPVYPREQTSSLPSGSSEMCQDPTQVDDKTRT